MAKTKRGSTELADVNRELQKVVNGGELLIGAKETVKALKRKEAKLVIYASNCPEELRDKFKDADSGEAEEVSYYKYPANSLELGLACGKPYSIASLCITDAGESELLRLRTYNVSHDVKTEGINVNR